MTKFACGMTAVILCFGAVQAQAGLFGIFGKGGCHKDGCCEECAPTCSAPAECCEDPNCCAPAGPACNAPPCCEDPCCEDGCADTGCLGKKKGGLLKKLFGCLKKKKVGCAEDCCPEECCPTCAAPSCCAPECAAPADPTCGVPYNKCGH